MNFFNSGAKVTKHVTGYTSADYVLEGVGLSAREAIAKTVLNEKALNDERRYARIEKEAKYKEQTESITESFLSQQRAITSVDEAYHEGKVLIFKDIVFEAFYNALYLDDDFKTATKESLYTLVSDYIDERGGYRLLENAIITTNSPVLKNIKSICEGTARKVCSRKMAEEDTSVGIDFSMNDEEQQQYDYDKSNCGIEELSKLVKDKVLTVVKDEKQREKQEMDFMEDLAEEAELDGKTVEEAMEECRIGGSVVEEATLFNSLFRTSYAEYLTESCGPKKKKKVEEGCEDDCDEEHDELELDMDVILAESITKYTLMELSYTVQLENYTTEDLRKMVQKMLNK